jgi:hypothetical protein
MDDTKYLLKLYEYLYSLNKPFVEYLENVLSLLHKNDWWDICVINILDENDLKKINKKKIKELNELDISILIKILIRNWKELSLINKNFNKKDFILINKIKDIRNFIAHPNEKTVSSTNLILYEEDLHKFANLIGAKLEESVEMLYKNNVNDNNKKLKLIELVNNKVLIPAINCKELNQDIIESVKDTKTRLEKKVTANEVYYFFYDALDARRGKQVYNSLKEHNLLTFEDILDEFFNVYWKEN